MLVESLNLENTQSVHKIQADILWSAAQPLERAISLPQAAYTDANFYQWEVANIFKKQWLCVGHISQVPQVGDYVAIDLLDEPIVLVRDKSNQVRVLSRVCPHRGADLMSPDEPDHGNLRNFICPYHRWTYTLDGQLVTAPEMQRHETWDRASMCLPKFRTEIWQGFVFLTLNPELDPVSKLYADLQSFIERWNIGDMEVVDDRTWNCPFNWKVLAENFIEGYHHIGVHQQTLEPMMPTLGTWAEREKPNYIVCHLPLAKHLVEHIKAGNTMQVFNSPRGLNRIDAYEYTAYFGLPNFLLLVGPDRVYSYLVQPQAADRLVLRTMFLITRESKRIPDYPQFLVQEVESFKRIIEEDVDLCKAVQRGLGSQHYKPGPLSHLEMPVWLFHRYLARQIHESIDA